MAVPIDRNRIRDLLEEWASEDEQRRLWLSDGANGTEVSSFIEARACLFTDTDIGRHLDSGRVVLDASADAMLKRLDMLISKIDADRAPDQIMPTFKCTR